MQDAMEGPVPLSVVDWYHPPAPYPDVASVPQSIWTSFPGKCQRDGTDASFCDEHGAHGPLILSHDQVQRLAPSPIEIAEPAVGVPVVLHVLEPQLLQRHDPTPELPAHPLPIGQRLALTPVPATIQESLRTSSSLSFRARANSDQPPRLNGAPYRR